jgi:hypothetical protein
MGVIYDRAFFFLLDGARVDVLSDLMRRGEMPNVSRYLGERGSVGEATSVFPTVTGVAYVPFATGCFPGPANLPGIRWFDPVVYGRTLLSMSRFRDYTGLGSYLMDRDLAPSVPTLFELCAPASNIFSGISRGTGVRRNAAYFLRIPYVFYWTKTANWDPIDRRGRAYLRAAVQRRSERFTFHTTLSVDEYSHKWGPFAPRVLEAYRRFDDVVGELVRELRATGQLERSLILLSADHGHSEVEKHLDMEGFFERRRLRTLYFPWRASGLVDCDVACMVGGNGMAHIYLRGPRGWSNRPDTDELIRRHPGLIDDLLGEAAIHLCAWRSAEPGWIHIRTRLGSADVRRQGRQLDYRVTGGDPFGYAPLPPQLTPDELLARTSATEYPEAPLQLVQLFASRRTGDLVVSAQPGWDLRARFERWEHRSCHGTLRREHIQVPLLSSHPLAPGPWRTADVFASIVRGLGLPLPECEGRDLVTHTERRTSEAAQVAACGGGMATPGSLPSCA